MSHAAINVNERGRAIVNEETCETSRAGVYLAGDGLGGPATVVEGIADALRAAQAVIGGTLVRDFEPETDEDTIYGRKGNLSDMKEDKERAEDVSDAPESARTAWRYVRIVRTFPSEYLIWRNIRSSMWIILQ